MPLLRRSSYAEAVEGRKRLLSRIGLFLVVFISYIVLTSFFLASYSISTRDMEPTLSPGDRLIATPLPLGPVTAFGKLPPLAGPSRGDLVIVRPPFHSRPAFLAAVADALLRFVTLQRLSIAPGSPAPNLSGPFVERVIALPGDEVSMRDFVFMVRAPGSSASLTEFEFTGKRYDIRRPALPAGWNDSMPLSGAMPARILQAGEYFVALDDRGASADSRAWGPVSPTDMEALVLLEYWPFRDFGPR